MNVIRDYWPHMVGWAITLLVYTVIISKQYGATKTMIEKLQEEVAKLEKQLETMRAGGLPVLCAIHEKRLETMESNSVLYRESMALKIEELKRLILDNRNLLERGTS